MDHLSMLSGLFGTLFGAVLIAGVISLTFLLCRMTVPPFANAWKAAFIASAIVIVVDSFGTALLPDRIAAIVVLAVGVIGAFFAYAMVLQTPEGEAMGNRATAMALAAHAVFSLAMFFLVYPVLASAFL